MHHNDIKRISRITAIMTQLQTRRLITATELSKKFQVSVRTIYRDMKVLEQAGVPIFTEEGKGYLLMEGYIVPPVMFTEGEANALITAEQLILKSNDSSFRKEYVEAIEKIRAVLRYSTKEKAELLSNRIAVSPAISGNPESSSLSLIQHALTSYRVLRIAYTAIHQNERTMREVEPFALYYSLEESWLLIAFCRLRNDFRMFRLDRISEIESLELIFEPHKLTLSEYLDYKKKNFTTPDS
jgi:predicted DNA-binding transcriptional regulator YafY